MSTSPTVFSAQTCLDLIRNEKLSPAEITREGILILGPRFEFDEQTPARPAKKRVSQKTPNKSTRQTSEIYKKGLINHFTRLVSSEFLTFRSTIETLTHDITRDIEGSAEKLRTITEETDRLSSTIAAAESLLSQLAEERKSLKSAPPTVEQVESGTQNPGNTSVPFEKFAGAPFDFLTYDELKSCFPFKTVFRSRRVTYYGDLPYKYSGGWHSPNPIQNNTKMQEIADRVKELYPHINFNSVLVTDYPDQSSYIPPHSDDEKEIEPDSTILTISVGGERSVLFREKPPSQRNEELREISLPVANGEVYIMTRQSQDHWDHAVPKPPPGSVVGPRISITFRQIRDIKLNHVQRPRRSQESPMSTHTVTPRRVLILSDSKNMDFDCSLLKSPVKVFRKNLFYLRDIAQHSLAIQQSDLVLISSGINDLRHRKASPLQIHNFLKSFTEQFQTQFLFDSICPMAMRADRFNLINQQSDRLNELLVHLSVHSKNFKLFENLNFGLSHLASDGLHLNLAGKSTLSGCWVDVILTHFGFRNKPLPIRIPFRQIVSSYYVNG